MRWSVVEEVHECGAALLPEIELRRDELEGLIRQAPDRATRQSLQTEQGHRLDLRDEKRAEAPIVTQRWDGNTQMFGDDRAEAEAETVEDRRAVLDDALATVWSCVAVQVAGRPESPVAASRGTDGRRPGTLRTQANNATALGRASTHCPCGTTGTTGTVLGHSQDVEVVPGLDSA